MRICQFHIEVKDQSQKNGNDIEFIDLVRKHLINPHISPHFSPNGTHTCNFIFIPVTFEISPTDTPIGLWNSQSFPCRVSSLVTWIFPPSRLYPAVDVNISHFFPVDNQPIHLTDAKGEPINWWMDRYCIRKGTKILGHIFNVWKKTSCSQNLWQM